MSHRKSPLYIFGRFWLYLVLIVTSILMMIPFYWSLGTSLKLEQFVFANPPQWWPDPLTWKITLASLLRFIFTAISSTVFLSPQ